VKWARERNSLSVDALVDKYKNYEQWESGEAYPTLRQAQELARKFRVPFGYLYLSTPPEEILPLPDLRTVAGAQPIKPSPDFLEVLYDALRKQQWYREYLESEDTSPLPFIDRFHPEDNQETVATDIRNTLGIDDNLRRKCGSWSDFLTKLVRQSENIGIVVLRNGVVGNNTHRSLNVEEFRGFAISDNLAPIVFINSKDAKVAQIFTFAHELAHLWIGASGVSNPDYALRSNQQQNDIERKCNSIAAEVLVPAVEFNKGWNDFTDVDDNLRRLAPKFKVSAFVILRRAYDLGKVQKILYQSKYKELLYLSQPPSCSDDTKKSRGNFENNFFARNSTQFATKALVAAAEGKLSPKIAANLLNVKLATVFSYQKELFGSGFANG
jgi:Zn-dependent peptidase ImmA (M78 family)